MEVDFFLKSGTVFIDGTKTDSAVRFRRAMPPPDPPVRSWRMDTLFVDDVEVPLPWKVRVHCRDGTIQTFVGVEV